MTAVHPTPLLAGFVLGDLEAREHELVEVHLLTCEPCRAEVAALRDALFSLSETLPLEPVPTGAWERLQARRMPAPPTPTPVPVLPAPKRPFSLYRMWPLAAAVSLGLVAGGFGTRSYLGSQQQVRIENLVNAGAQPLKLVDTQGQAFGTVLLLKDMQAVVFLDKSPPAGHVYQVWGRRKPQGGVVQAISLGMTEGTTLKVIRCNSYEFVGVSLEPVGGNATPTKPLGRAKIPISGT